MTQQKITLRPGVDTLQTATLNEAGFSSCNLIRWKQDSNGNSYCEKVGGWSALVSTPVTGVARSLHAFLDLSLIRYLAIGTNSRLQLFSNNVIQDITPITSMQDLSPAFSTASTSAVVNVKDVAHGQQTGNEVLVLVPVAVGGIVVQGYYTVTLVDSDNYTIVAASPATANITDGGAVPLFATTMGSATVQVTLAKHGYAIGDTFPVQVSTAVGGVTLDGNYIVVTVPTVDTFTIGASALASGSTSGSENGGNARLDYLLPPGPATGTYSAGYGTGGYGEGGYGEGAGTLYTPPRIWSLDNFEENLLASPSGLGIYIWTPPYTTDNRATQIMTAPLYNTAMFVATPALQVVSLGAEVSGTQDPQLIRWSDTGSYTVWTASSSNQAGSYHLSSGSRIIGGMSTPLTILVWTDIDVWSMAYIGTPFIYDFQVLGTGCGLIAQQAVTRVNRDVYWMSLEGFYRFGGSVVEPIPCAVWDEIFGNLDRANSNKIIAAANSPFTEIAWYYPSLDGGGDIDSYVKINTVSGLWDYGTLRRTAWLDQSIFGLPIGVDGDGLLEQHETSNDANGSAMLGVFAESGYADIADGTDFPMVNQIIPDFVLDGSNPTIDLTIKTKRYPNGDVTVHGPYTVTSTTDYIRLRARGRQASFRIDCSAPDTFFRMGAPRLNISPAGRR